jgi:hypothetical protein
MKSIDGRLFKVGDHVKIIGSRTPHAKGYVLDVGAFPETIEVEYSDGTVLSTDFSKLIHNPGSKKRGGNRWIQKALRHHKKGALHRQLHVPAGEKIPLRTLKAASHKPGKVGRRARLAMTLRKMSKRPKRGKRTK